MPATTITRDELGERFLAAADHCLDEARNGDGHAACLQAQAAQGFIAAYEKLIRLDYDAGMLGRLAGEHDGE